MGFAPRGRHWDEFQAGETFTTAARTVTEGAVDLFAGLSGDFNPLHTDEESARQRPMKGRIAHGMLVLSVATGLANQLGLFEGTTLALLGMDRIRWTAPVRLGDTVHAELTIREKKEASKPDRGVLVTDVAVKNQRGEVVMTAEWTTLMARKH
ncbi:MAG: MaoC/PaaZ C-terminal domain-containing protein [Candidatus Rokuibacteriota bacterium]